VATGRRHSSLYMDVGFLACSGGSYLAHAVLK
jgi:hypothetical protein